MLAYMEVENDIFQLQKFGLTPNADVYFYFDSTDFACDLATKVGQYKEYKIKETEIVCEVPECVDDIMTDIDPYTGKITSCYISSEVFPYRLGLGYNEYFFCDMLSGKLSVEIAGYEVGKEYTVICNPYEHTDFKVEFPSNKYIYQSLQHKICNDDYIDSHIVLKYHVEEIKESKDVTKYILYGKISGSILFYDINSIGKYVEKIHPMVGDIVTIDFPDETNREQYEIVDCFDKQLTPDGISPLLHKYIWKCKARRYINQNEDFEKNEANERLEEKLRHDANIKEEITKKISIYDDNEDAVYGGYDAVPNEYDSKIPDGDNPSRIEFLDNGMALDILRFGCGSRLVTDGYSLIFVTGEEEPKQVEITTKEFEFTVTDKVFEAGQRWLKATDSTIVFVNIDGNSTKIAEDKIATANELEICLNSLYDSTLDDKDINIEGDNFLKFKGSRSYLWATETDLYAKLASNNNLYKLT